MANWTLGGVVVGAIAVGSIALVGCGGSSPSPSSSTCIAPAPGLGNCDQTGPGSVPCSEFVASDFAWHIEGFWQWHILDGTQIPPPTDVVALLEVGERISLQITTHSTKTTMGCQTKAESVQWLLSDPSVARADLGGDRLQATLVALRPGETTLSARVTFGDGSAPREAAPRVSLGSVLSPVWKQIRVVRVN